MKTRINAVMIILAALVMLPVASLAGAPPPDPPSITITSPTTGTTIYVPAFPATVPISFGVTYSELKSVGALNVLVDDVSIFTDGNDIDTDGDAIGNPFGQDNKCFPALMTLPNISACRTNKLDSATVTAPWTVALPGIYSVAVVAKVKGDEGSDTEAADIELSLISIEYPAPPSVANAYIKSNKTTFGKLTGGARGCIISQIAKNHAKDSKYGPKGGPYYTSMIQADVDLYKLSCAIVK